jgi:hypothetical protein
VRSQPVDLGMPALKVSRPDRFCDENPLAGMESL